MSLKESKLNDNDTTTESFIFEEIRPQLVENRPKTLQAYAIQVEPKECSKIVKQLAVELPLSEELSHLKRVRNPQKMKSVKQTTKRPKLLLQVLLGLEQSPSLIQKYGPVEEVTIPGRPPKSNEEWKEMNQIWPTSFLPLNTEEHKEEILALQPDEIQQMNDIMKREVWNAEKKVVVVVNPSNGSVVSCSDQEEALQASVDTAIYNNPLATPIIFALQGVSRQERHASTTLSSEEFTKGQYLCTGYDLYTYYQPTVFEAMATLHHRVRRVIYIEDHGNLPKGSVLTRGFSKKFIHSLPGTNHRFRVFECKQK